MDRQRATITRLFASAVALAALPGCYEHVIDARGFGSEHAELHEPNLPDDAKEPGAARRAEDLEDTGARYKPRSSGSARGY